MKFVKIILQFGFLYSIYLIGVFLQTIVSLPVPGSIIGMILLFGALQVNLVKRKWFSLGSSFLLKFLPLFFIPATVGVIDYLHLFKGSGLISIVIVLVSTFIVMITSAFVSDILLSKGEEFCKDKGLHL